MKARSMFAGYVQNESKQEESMNLVKTVSTRDGVEKKVSAPSKKELAEAVAIAKQDQAQLYPDINNPKDGNKIVTPDATVDPTPHQGVPEQKEVKEEQKLEEKKIEVKTSDKKQSSKPQPAKKANKKK
jgi:hypothetical protein